MSKRISKSDALRILNAADALEVIQETVDRKETSAAKKSKLNRFAADVQKQINEERDVILISIKVK
ncbi:MAG: hypothetical protein ACOX2O_08735 [Bdellovibrionota bacterium]|jgi:F420-dependent methylenetetrahydromethanopterin dehydrogenase